MTELFYMTCPAHCEELLKSEIETAGGTDIKIRVRSVTFRASRETAYRLCLYSRIGNVLYQTVAEGHAVSAKEIAAVAGSVEWETVFPLSASFAVSCKTASNNKTEIIHSRYGALLLKDAVCDRFRKVAGERPVVSTERPDVRLHLQIVHSHVMVCVNWSGEMLNRRGYRISGVEAPLKENTAAAVVARCRRFWERASFIVDPMCGSGTLLIEAAAASAGIPAGLLRSRRQEGFGFFRLNSFDAALWQRLCDEAEAAAEYGKRTVRRSVRFLGFDIDRRAVAAAEADIAAAGLSEIITVRQADFRNLQPDDFPQDWEPEKTAVIVNPPYGERLGHRETIPLLYQALGEKLKSVFPGASACILCGHSELVSSIGLKPVKTAPFRNGALETILAVFVIFSKQKREELRQSAESEKSALYSGQLLSAGAGMFVNRLKKNEKEWRKTEQSRQVTAYRLYDADMPEYNAAIDVYIPVEGEDLSPRICLAEYRPPSTVSEEARRKRLKEMTDGLLSFFKTDRNHLYFKTRFRQKNGAVYTKMDYREASFVIREEDLKFEVNLSDYLDTGIYLDHRPLRRIIRREAEGARFLNLFSYTATASVCAAAGGALRVVSVDASARYLGIGKRNFERNGFSVNQADWIQSDVIQFLNENKDQYDLIYLDPPTFSNSKSARQDFDLQKIQGKLVRLCMNRLSSGGILYFSNHFQRFIPDEALLREFPSREISEKTIDPDFQRNSKIHRCWRFEKE